MSARGGGEGVERGGLCGGWGGAGRRGLQLIYKSVRVKQVIYRRIKLRLCSHNLKLYLM